MIIAVHISFSDTQSDPLKNFNYRCFSILAGKYPQHHFIFLFDKPFSAVNINHKNIATVLIPPQIKNRLLSHYWYNFKIPGILKKYNTDLFISHGVNISTRTSVRQCMVLPDLSFLEKENLYTRSDSRYLKKYFKTFVTKAVCIAVTNQQTGIELSGIFPQVKDKIHVTGFGLNEINRNIGFDENQNTRDKFTAGKEYFICFITDVSVSNTTVLLKAFSAFKKRQLSNMQLVMAFTTSHKENTIKDFATYKYRNEVTIITPENDEILAKITAAAYAAIYLPAIDVTEDKGLLALINNTPLITVSNEFCKSLYNDAALYAKAEEQNIAEKMMLLYKNENLKNSLANIGNLVGAIYSWDNTAANLWQSLLHTAVQ